MKPALIAAAILACCSASAQKPFAPLEAWKAAVLAGDEASFSKLYRTEPEASILQGPNLQEAKRIPLKDEYAFWMKLKPAGIDKFTPRVLEMTNEKNGNVFFVLRFSVVSGDARTFIVERQEWSKAGNDWKIVAGRHAAAFSPEPTRTLPQPLKPNTALYAEPQEAEAEIKAGLAKAAKEHKRVILVFGGNWCYDCHVLDTTFRSKDFAPLVEKNFVVIHVNIGDDVKDNNDVAARYGVVLDKGVPSLGVLESDGTVVFAQKNGEFEDTVKFGPAEVRAFLEKWKPRRG